MPYGTPIKTSQPWQVVEQGENALSGKFVRVRYADGSEHSFAHLSRFPGKSRGGPGEPMGFSGKDGDDRNGHLHARSWVGGKEVDPATYYGRRGKR